MKTVAQFYIVYSQYVKVVRNTKIGFSINVIVK